MLPETLPRVHDDSQIAWVYRELLKGRELTPKDGFKAGITRLAALVWLLRKKYNIPVEDEQEFYTDADGRRRCYARYYIENI